MYQVRKESMAWWVQCILDFSSHLPPWLGIFVQWTTCTTVHDGLADYQKYNESEEWNWRMKDQFKCDPLTWKGKRKLFWKSATKWMQVCVPNAQWGQTIPKRWSLEQRKIYCRAKQGDGWFMPPQTPNCPMGFRKAFLKARWGRGVARYVISSCTIPWLVDGEVTGQCHRGQHYQSSGPSRPGGYTQIHQVVNIFHSVGGFHICKTTQEMCIRYCYLGTSERS